METERILEHYWFSNKEFMELLKRTKEEMTNIFGYESPKTMTFCEINDKIYIFNLGTTEKSNIDSSWRYKQYDDYQYLGQGYRIDTKKIYNGF
jgi:hypothetical protein